MSICLSMCRWEGYAPLALLNFVMRSGGGFAGGRDLEKLYSLDEMTGLFDLALLKRSPVAVDQVWMAKFNKMAMGQVDIWGLPLGCMTRSFKRVINQLCENK